MTPDAEVAVRLLCSQGRVRSVSVATSRRALPRQLVDDRTPDEVAQLVPQLFSVCRNAQAAAAAGALEAARGTQVCSASIERRRFDVTLEALQETFWRLLIDWPESMGEAPAVAAVRQARDAAANIARDGTAIDTALAEFERIASASVYGESPMAWLERDLARLDEWIADGRTLPAGMLRRMRSEAPGLGRSDTRLLPHATLERLQQSLVPHLLRDDGYPMAPHWDGVPAETGAVARQAEHPIVAACIARDGVACEARFIARLVELALLMDALRAPDPVAQPSVRQHRLQPGQGIGLAETARGLLLHHAEVADGRVVDYSIVAPTEWNFHAAGPIRALLDTAASNEGALLQQARIVVRSLDPCVTSRIEIDHA